MSDAPSKEEAEAVVQSAARRFLGDVSSGQGCPSMDVLARYADQRGSDSFCDRVEAHLANCATCRSTLANAGARRAAGSMYARRRTLLSLAAGFLLLIGAAAWYATRSPLRTRFVDLLAAGRLDEAVEVADRVDRTSGEDWLGYLPPSRQARDAYLTGVLSVARGGEGQITARLPSGPILDDRPTFSWSELVSSGEVELESEEGASIGIYSVIGSIWTWPSDLEPLPRNGRLRWRIVDGTSQQPWTYFWAVDAGTAARVRADLEQASRLTTEPRALDFLRAALLIDEGLWTDARPYLEKLLESNQGSRFLHEMLALAYHRLGMMSDLEREQEWLRASR